MAEFTLSLQGDDDVVATLTSAPSGARTSNSGKSFLSSGLDYGGWLAAIRSSYESANTLEESSNKDATTWLILLASIFKDETYLISSVVMSFPTAARRNSNKRIWHQQTQNKYTASTGTGR